MIKKYSLILFFCLLTANAFAQSNGLLDRGSIYSKFGLGLPTIYGGSSAEGMGLWGVSFIEPNVPSTANPAQWGSTVYTVATGGIGLTTYFSEDKSGSLQHSLLKVNHFQLVLPVYKRKLGISAAFMPYTNTSFKIMEEGQKITNRDTLNYQTINFANGGINKLQLGIGWRINKNISVGYAASLVFAQVDKTYSTIFQQQSAYGIVNKTIQTHGIGLGHRFGVYFNFPSVFKDEDALSIGANVTLPVELDAERELERLIVTRNEENKLTDDKNIDNGSIQLPMGITGGITYQPIPKLSFTVEGLYQGWSEFKNTMETEEEGALVDRYKIGAGVRYFPFLTGSDKFLSTFKYRLGVAYDQGHLKLNGHRIETLMFSFGLGYITPFTTLGNSSIDISFHYGIRGTKADNLVKENIWKVKLSINLAELFFYRPKVR